MPYKDKGHLEIEDRGAVLVVRVDGGPHQLFGLDIAHQLDKLVVDHTDHRLAGRKAPDYVLAQRPVTHAANEIPDDRKCDVGLEQRDAHLAQRGLHVLFGDARLAAQRLHHARQALSEIVEHGMTIR